MTPVFRFQQTDLKGTISPYLEAAAGRAPAVRNIGRAPNAASAPRSSSATTSVSACRFGDKAAFDLAYRYQHLSNAGIKKPNHGINFNRCVCSTISRLRPCVATELRAYSLSTLTHAVTQVLARKWRPRSFAELVGQEHVVRALTNALEQKRLHHAYLFTGTRGVGKTTLARIMAKALNCETGVTAVSRAAAARPASRSTPGASST